MVRFHWHVEDGSGASIPAGAMSFHKDTAVQHINCNIEIPGEPHAQAIITVPRGYLSEGKVKEAGILLGHDTPESWDGALLTGIAVALAEAGHVVVRYHSDGRELRRQRLYEKALDVCATSPFARFVQRWVLAGVGHGARLAAVVGSRVRGTVCGYVLVSFPVADPLQTAKGPLLPDSSILLLRLQAPTLFVQAAGDSKHPPAQMRKVAAQMKPATVPRLVEVPDVDAAFEAGDPPVLQPETLEAVTKPIVEFVNAVGANSLDNCSLPPANPSGTAATELSDSAAAQIQAQIQILDADDTAVYDVEPLGRPGEAPGSGANGAQQRAVQQQQLLQQQLQIQVLQQQQAQQVQLAAAAAKAGISMQQAAAQRAAAAAVAAAGAAGKIPLNLAAAAAAAAAAGSAGAAGAGPAASGAPIVLGAGGFTQITPQMLAAAQAMQLAAAKQGMRPVLPAAAAAAAAAAQQQQGAQQHAKDS